MLSPRVIRPRLESAPVTGAVIGVIAGAVLWEALVYEWGMPGAWDDAVVLTIVGLLSIRCVLAADEEALRILRGRSYYPGFGRAALRWAALGLVCPLTTVGGLAARFLARRLRRITPR